MSGICRDTPHIWRQRVGQIANLSYIWADTTAIPNEPIGLRQGRLNTAGYVFCVLRYFCEGRQGERLFLWAVHGLDACLQGLKDAAMSP